jgi:hypothetical protein
MTDYRMSSATIAFGDVAWPNCGVVLKETSLIFNREGDLTPTVWPVYNVQVNGPRSWIARRVEDDALISIVRSGGCGCR